jgi:hypothetical protein
MTSVLRSGSFSSLSYLEAEDFRLNEIQRLAIDFDKALAFLLPAWLSVSFQFFLVVTLGDDSGVADLAVGDCRGCLLLAEALYTLRGRHGD